MQQCRVTTAVTQPKEEVTVVGCFFFEKKKKEKRKETSCFKLDNPERFFLMVKKCYCFYKRKWLNILHIDWTNTYKKSRSTRLLMIFRQSAKGDVICSKQIRDFLLAINENKWTVCWSNRIFSWNAGKICPTQNWNHFFLFRIWKARLPHF